MTWDEGISGVHKEIAASSNSRIGILAGPGTGKTGYGLMRRVARLLEEGVPGDRILLLSFTRVAAADLRDKIAALNAPDINRVRATTLHGYCFGVLQQEAVLNITGRIPRILLSHEADLMLRDIGGDFGNIHERRRRLEAFVSGWARGLNDHPGTPTDPTDRAFEHGVMRWLYSHKAMLIGEVVPEAYKFLSGNPQAPALDAFDHIIVDEYQDLNVLEQRLLDKLSENRSLCVAGDDDQSIYSVRYANPHGIQGFLRREDVAGYSISVCGRCPTSILDVANSVIKNAPGRTKDDLTSLDECIEGRLSIVQWRDPDCEAEGIVNAIKTDIESGWLTPGQILVLTNWRKLGEKIRNGLSENGVRAESFFREEELDSDNAKQALALLRLVVNEEDGPALRVLLGIGDTTGRSDAYQRLTQFCLENGQTIVQILNRLNNGEKLPLNVPALVKRFASAKAKVTLLKSLESSDLVNELFPEGDNATAGLRTIALDAINETEDAASMLYFLIESITQDDVPQNPDYVRVMSLHKSKGLTSDCVYVAGAVDGVLPTVRADDTAAIEAAISEGRRLFYVAVTRAARELVISNSISMDLNDAHARGICHEKYIRTPGGRFLVRTIASPYIAELGPNAPDPVTGDAWLANRGSD